MPYLFREKRQCVDPQQFIRRDGEPSFDPKDIVRRKEKVYVPAAEVVASQFSAATEPEAVIYP